ncbi:MAG: hypothetical protein J0H00_13980 [Burkholderiales bacterium]|nr:hypothetical protein [Burkholderiales bacterium]
MPFHRQAKLDFPPDRVDIVEPPLWVWDIQGNGRVAIGGVGYEVGSAELIDLEAAGAGEPCRRSMTDQPWITTISKVPADLRASPNACPET